MPNNSCAFTVCSLNYLRKAVVLKSSYETHNPNSKLYIAIADRKQPIQGIIDESSIIWVEDLNYPNVYDAAFKYNIIEFNTAIKPWATLKLLEKHSKVIYFDPDVFIHSSVDHIRALLDKSDFILTPHATSPYEGKGRPNDTDLLKFGCFNLGFYAANQSDNSKRILEWWHIKLIDNCFYEPSLGLGVDQKWMDLSTAFFDNIHTLKDPGYNLAFWNLHERSISKTDGTFFVNKKHKLIFTHFSSYCENEPNAIAAKQTRYPVGSREDFAMLRKPYDDALAELAPRFAEHHFEYGFGSLNDGSDLDQTTRRIYSHLPASIRQAESNPFDTKSVQYQTLHKLGYAPTTKRTSKNPLFTDTDKHSKALNIFTIALKAIYRLIGPSKYYLLSRAMSHYGSILNQKEVFFRNEPSLSVEQKDEL